MRISSDAGTLPDRWVTQLTFVLPESRQLAGRRADAKVCASTPPPTPRSPPSPSPPTALHRLRHLEMSIYPPSRQPTNALNGVGNMNDGSGTINPAALNASGTLLLHWIAFLAIRSVLSQALHCDLFLGALGALSIIINHPLPKS